jgi:beta-galactosidase
MWSLGNESGYGAAHDAAAAWVRRNDPTRPLHYEGAVAFDLNAEAPVTDVVCPMYPSIDDIVGWADTATDARRPLIMCEYSHAMGNSNGSLADYWDAIRSHHGLQGGFIWEWLEHGIPLEGTGPAGRPVWGYGGDFGDAPNDANFVCDGLVSADRVPHPALEEVRWVGRPVVAGWSDDSRQRLQITSRRWFSDTSDLAARWLLTVDGDEVARGELDVPPLRPGASVEVPVPARSPELRPGQVGHLTVSWSQTRATPWAAKGHVVGWDQLELSVPRPAARAAPGVPVDAAGGGSGIPAGVDPFQAAPTLVRALTDNDGLRQGWMREHLGHLRRWIDVLGLDRCTWEPGEPRRRTVAGAAVWTSTGRLVVPGAAEPVAVRRRIEERPDGWTNLRVGIRIPSDLVDLPRVGVGWELPPGLERLEWFGDGPHECYPDRRAAARVGRWSTTVTETYVDYVVPQEHGHRTGMRWLALRPERRRRGSPHGVLVVVDPAVDEGTLGFAARHHSDAELWAARHTDELEEPGPDRPTWLYLDAAHRGVGTASCGPDTEPPYRTRPGNHTVSVWIRSLPADSDAGALAAEIRSAGGAG